MDSGKEVGIKDLTSKLELSESAIHRILMNLESNRYVEGTDLLTITGWAQGSWSLALCRR
jgi:DNA-binding IclR family transcriptional regulator